MRVAVFVVAFPVWTETFIIRQITGLIDRGHEVDIYAIGRRQLKDIHNDVHHYRLLERTTYLDAAAGNFIMRIFKAIGFLCSPHVLFKPHVWPQIIRSLGFRNQRFGAWTTLRILRLTTLLAERKPYDVIHCQFGTLGPPALFLKQIGALSGKLITSFRGHDATQHHRIKAGFYDELFRQGDLFLPVSRDLKQRLIDMGCDASKISVLHSGIDISKFTYRDRQVNPEQPINIISIARLVEMKGIHYSIQAVAQLIKQGRDITYTIIGDGELRSELEQLITELEVGDHISILGWKKHEEVQRLLADAHILVAPSVTASRGETEGIPNAVKEAMAIGLPVVSTLHGGNAELIEDGVSGFLVAERNADALAERLAYLCDHPERWPEMGRAGRAHIEAEFDIETLNNRLVDLYQT